MKSNPYVYPFVPFKDLSNRDIQDNFGKQKAVSLKDVHNFLFKLPFPKAKVQGATTGERILSIFKDEEIRFGPLTYIEQYHSYWEKKFNFFIEQGSPLQLTILGFPFKVPVPFKTNRKLPDAGEALALLRLYVIAEKIQEIYNPGARVTVFTEGGFGAFNGVPEQEWRNYSSFLRNINSGLGFDSLITIRDLSDMEKDIPDFRLRHARSQQELKKLYEQRDSEILKKYKGTYESLLRIMSTREYDENLLFEVYDDKLSDKEISREALRVRETIRQRTHSAVFSYHAYLGLRDDIDYIEKTVPHYIALSVSPKPYRLGILPIHKECVRLPYHGIPVYYPQENQCLIEYLIDVRRSKYKYTPVIVEEDKEEKPFYYIVST